MALKIAAVTLAAATLCIAAGASPASAQESCGDLYNRVMGTYQTLGAQSPQYAQMVNYYNTRCLSGASAGQPSPAYAYQAAAPYGYQQPDPYAYYQQPAPYGYYQPAVVDPAAALVGGVVGGALLGEALEGDRGRRHDYDHRR